jgi:hypothetical protein
MRQLFLCSALGLLVVAGCTKKDEKPLTQPTNAASGNPLTAPADYLGAVGRAKTVSEKVIDTTSLNQAVQLFYAGEGRYPRDLKELVDEQYLPKIPEPPRGMKIVYDAARGQVRIVPQTPTP